MNRRGPYSRRREVDDIDLAHLLAGDFTARQVHTSVRAAAVSRLSEQGLRPTEIAARLAMNIRTVHRYRARHRSET